jgi:small-conductance mechanosensitive channel
MPYTQGYWDGTRWTEHTAPMAQRPFVMPAQQVSDTMIGVGYVASLFLPIVGFVIGIVVLAKGGRSQVHGGAMMAISLVVFGLLLSRIAA